MDGWRVESPVRSSSRPLLPAEQRQRHCLRKRGYCITERARLSILIFQTTHFHEVLFRTAYIMLYVAWVFFDINIIEKPILLKVRIFRTF